MAALNQQNSSQIAKFLEFQNQKTQNNLQELQDICDDFITQHGSNNEIFNSDDFANKISDLSNLIKDLFVGYFNKISKLKHG